MGLSELLEGSKDPEALCVSRASSVEAAVLLSAPGDQSHVISSPGARFEHLLSVGSRRSEEATRRGARVCVCVRVRSRAFIHACI